MFSCYVCYGSEPQILENIISIGGASNGIIYPDRDPATHSPNHTFCVANSILGNGGTGAGILMIANGHGGSVNNLVEGFSGSGGRGIDLDSFANGWPDSSWFNYAMYGNAMYDNAIDLVPPDKYGYSVFKDNEFLGSSPFAKTGSDTFANRFAYFAPVNTGNVLTGGFHGSCKGAVSVG